MRHGFVAGHACVSADHAGGSGSRLAEKIRHGYDGDAADLSTMLSSTRKYSGKVLATQPGSLMRTGKRALICERTSSKVCTGFSRSAQRYANVPGA